MIWIGFNGYHIFANNFKWNILYVTTNLTILKHIYMKTNKKRIFESIDKFESENLKQTILGKSHALAINGGITVQCNDADGCMHTDELTVGTAIAPDLKIGPYSRIR